MAARLVKPQIGGNVRHGRSYTVKGQMAPGEKDATVTVTFYRMTTVKRGVGHARKTIETWVVQGDPVLVDLKLRNAELSTWTMKWTPLSPGWYKVVVSHEDAAHVASSATTYKWVR